MHHFKSLALAFGLAMLPLPALAAEKADGGKPPTGIVRVPRTDDFEVTGAGKDEAWKKAEWVAIPRKTKEGLPYESRFKVLYSPTGLYVLFDGTDKTLTTTGRKDFDNLWEEDVYEVFLWTDEALPLYFEYEISPLGHELPILVPNVDGQIMGWIPWHFGGGRKTRKGTAAAGGKKEQGAAVTGWSAEIFIPYELLKPLKNVPPKPGTEWRANFYRMDYDAGKHTMWTWQPIDTSFHEYRKFGTLVFE
jgi:Carbohydrate family 9 binding domain-like